jgi:hypothetical protein
MKIIIIIILMLFQTSVCSQAPPPPVFLGLDDSTSLTPKLLWSRVPSATSYGLQILTGPVVIINQSNIPDTFYQLPAGLMFYTLYYLRLNAANSYGSGSWSPVYQFILHPPIGIKSMSTEIPDKFSLYQNYPNPFNPVTKIKFDIPPSKGARGMITQLINYDILGREISTLVNEQLNPGTYEVEWDASNYPSGVYFYKLTTSNYTETRKMVLMK